MSGTALDRESILELIQADPPLMQGFRSLEEQLQPNGFDLTVKQVDELSSAGGMGRQPDQRELSATRCLEADSDGWLELPLGPYLVTFNEVVNLPADLMALGRPRSSLLRSGVAVHSAVWDAGYRGRSQALLVVYNPQGYRLQTGARLLQLVYFRLARPVAQGYEGRYLNENLCI